MRRVNFGLRALILIAALCLPALPRPLPLPQPQTQTVEETAARLERALQSLKTLQADFDQYYRSVTVSTPLHEKGRFFFQKPDLMRWEYTDPEPKVFTYKDSVFSQYYPEDNQLIRSSLSKSEYESEVLTLLSGKRKLADAYIVERDLASPPAQAASRLKLTPRTEGQYASIVLELDPRTGLIGRAVFQDWAENRTEFIFSKIKENGALRPSVFVLTVPPETEIIDDASPLVIKRGPLEACR